MIFFSTLLYIFLFYIVVQHSTKEISTYKYYILCYATTVYLVELSLALIQVEPLLPYPMFVVGGLGKFVNFGEFNYFLADFVIFVIACAFYTTATMFVYRYAACTGNFLDKVVTSWKLCAIVHPALLALPILFVIVPLHTHWASQENIMKALKEVDEALYEKYKDRIIIGVLVGNV